MPLTSWTTKKKNASPPRAYQYELRWRGTRFSRRKSSTAPAFVRSSMRLRIVPFPPSPALQFIRLYLAEEDLFVLDFYPEWRDGPLCRPSYVFAVQVKDAPMAIAVEILIICAVFDDTPEVCAYRRKRLYLPFPRPDDNDRLLIELDDLCRIQWDIR